MGENAKAGFRGAALMETLVSRHSKLQLYSIHISLLDISIIRPCWHTHCVRQISIAPEMVCSYGMTSRDGFEERPSGMAFGNAKCPSH